MITAPFNFVPLENQVFLPDWNEQISHDIPFEDGVSGSIDIKITAESPIFVRNGYVGETKDNSFSVTPDGKYFIPGSSIKGAIRSVLEIMSFGKMNRVQDRKFGVRELTDSSYTKNMRNNHCGWLSFDGENYKLEDCGKIDLEKHLITAREIDAFVMAKFQKSPGFDAFISDKENFKNDKNREAYIKYKMIYEILSSKNKFEEDFVDTDVCFLDYTKDQNQYQIILTGQSGARFFDPQKDKPVPSNKDYIEYCNENGIEVPEKEEWTKLKNDLKKQGAKICDKGCWTGKRNEFLFPKKTIRIYQIDEKVIEDFKTIHAESPDYVLYWVKRLIKGKKIPVFFHLDGNKVHSIGLSYLYKYPSKYSVHNSIYKELLDQKDKDGNVIPDLAECIFGYTNNSDCLKGRVQFGAAIATGSPRVLSPEGLALWSPKPSYYPIYRRGRKWDLEGTISGRKMYNRWNRTAQQSSKDENVNSTITPLDKGNIFISTIRFFNLRPCEFGALLASISFLGDNGRTFKHSIGQGKPYGYGICKIEVTGGSIIHKADKPQLFDFQQQIEYIKCFVDKMDEVISDTKWIESESIKTLFAIAGTRPKVPVIHVKNERVDKVYMQMSTTETNEFKYKDEYDRPLSLKPYPTSGITFPDLSSILQKAQAERQEREQQEQLLKEKKAQEQKALAMMQELKVGDTVIAKYLGVKSGLKKARIISPLEIDAEIQLVIPKTMDEPSISTTIKCVVTQISPKTSLINQIKLLNN